MTQSSFYIENLLCPMWTDLGLCVCATINK